jgi:hypothetical protein
MTRVPLGQIVCTPGALGVLDNHRCLALLKRHASGDWGEVSADDRAANYHALENGERILSAYRIDPAKPFAGDNRLWIITEHDRSVTTLLLPDEY